ncbi:MAG: outer membrane protein assembly factor BamB [Woeseiaceae bacterium]|nr:outer membrane protein assembly factor BamB [Woeseiaceae bacterium]
MRAIARGFTLLFAAAGIAACGIFGDDDELKPAELLDFEPKVRVKKLWSARLGGDAEFLRVALRPAGDGNRIYAASVDGDVFAFDPETGRQIWRTRLDERLSAGPGVGGGLLAVVSADGYVIALEADSGAVRWRSDVRGESLAAPAVSANAVIVQTVDNRLRALEAFDGRERWVVLQSMPRLTMRGTASPVIAGSNVITGFDNGRLVAVNIDSGDVLWEALLAPPTGRSDLERLSDVDGAIAVVGQDVFAAGYQGRIASVALESGQLLWASEISSHRGVSVDWSSLYTVQDGGELIALARRNGAENWRTAALLRREPTLPVPFATTVAAGDFEGYLHFFTNVDGTPAARVKVGGAAITNDPVVLGNTLYVQTDGGTLAAFTIQQPERRAPDIAETPEEGA